MRRSNKKCERNKYNNGVWSFLYTICIGPLHKIEASHFFAALWNETPCIHRIWYPRRCSTLAWDCKYRRRPTECGGETVVRATASAKLWNEHTRILQRPILSIYEQEHTNLSGIIIENNWRFFSVLALTAWNMNTIAQFAKTSCRLLKQWCRLNR